MVRGEGFEPTYH